MSVKGHIFYFSVSILPNFSGFSVFIITISPLNNDMAQRKHQPTLYTPSGFSPPVINSDSIY
ncbi:hypothetical protein XSR1_50095 [Xenorhabdus szentirmaii DSM 16338]|uniref:Uncharacterized protein n=1 Tax=Xenorhabdus szentirmaii DSM 16338 TaxID=1427518 RepID=W1J3P9_9GAMM|nr:hypothetical protein XSR1_50095 [Xenorhabdus szentirmaii DSM 16338]